MPDLIKITYYRSAIGRSYRQKRIIRALGFRKLNNSRVVENTPAMMGMINKVVHLLKIDPVDAVLDEKTVQAEVVEPIEKKPVKKQAETLASPEVQASDSESEKNA